MNIYRENKLISFDDLKHSEKSRYMQLIDKFRIDMVDIDEIFDKFNFIIYCLENINLTLNIIESNDDFNDVFHSLNSKNVPLSNWDILRNFVYKSNAIWNENILEKIDGYVNRNKDDKNKNKIDFKDIDKVLSAFYMFRKKEVLKNEKEKLQKIESLIKVDFQEELNHLLNSFKVLIEFKTNETRKELQELIVIFKLIKKLNLKQIEKVFLWTVIEYEGFKETEIFELKKILSFYKKLIINFVYFVLINNQRANFFEKFIKRSIFLKEVFEKNYDYDLIFEDFEEFNLILSEKSIENAKNNDSIIKKLNENYKMVYLLFLLNANNLSDYIILDNVLNWKKPMFSDKKIMSNYYFYNGSGSPSILDLEQQNRALLTKLKTNNFKINTFIEEWLLTIVEDEEILINKNNQMLDSFFIQLKFLNNL